MGLYSQIWVFDFHTVPPRLPFFLDSKKQHPFLDDGINQDPAYCGVLFFIRLTKPGYCNEYSIKKKGIATALWEVNQKQKS
ncbi:hypothetical protein BFP75_17020 [Maribacter sp. 4G9]|nr:hypothetical protein BFP75_17020 [Maribacter sp. 4G9]